jgi:hypothetical protein
MSSDHFASRSRQSFENGWHARRSRPESRLDGTHIEPSTRTQELPPTNKTGQRLVNRRAAPQMQKSLRVKGRTFRHLGDFSQDPFR